MSENRCSDCAYYRQHYTFDDRRIFRVFCGHCTFGKVKQKRPDAKACKGFAPGTPQEEAFVSKEYLSKELLRYTMELDLLPEIGE